MKKIKSLLLIACSFLLMNCSTNQITKLHIENRNPYPIEVVVQANNVIHRTSSIAANQTQDEIFDWTQIERKDGQWHFKICNANTQTCDSFTHGYFRMGELFSFVNLISEGGELKVEIAE